MVPGHCWAPLNAKKRTYSVILSLQLVSEQRCGQLRMPVNIAINRLVIPETVSLPGQSRSDHQIVNISRLGKIAILKALLCR
jgi:hypothetical protein